MLRAGVDKAIRDVIVGHTLRGMDAFYLQLSDEDLREGMKKFTAWFDKELSDVTHFVTQEAVGQS